MLDPPIGIELPSDGFDCEDSGYIEPKKTALMLLFQLILNLIDCNC